VEGGKRDRVIFIHISPVFDDGNGGYVKNIFYKKGGFEIWKQRNRRD
jgi:hypothetical protein